MAKVFLDVDETSVNIANDGDEVFGQTGDESVNILAGVTGVVLDGNVEAVTLDGDLADYEFQQQGNQLLIYSGGELVATLPIQTDEDGTQLTFDDGAYDVEFGDGAVINIGGTDVPSDEPGPVVPPVGDTFTLAEAVALGEDLPAEYTIVDEAANLFDNGAFATGAEDILDGAAVIEVSDAITVAQYDLIDGLTTFDVANLTYDVADTFEILYANQDVVDGSGSYELTDAEGTDFGRVTEEEATFIEGADNYVEGYWDYSLPVDGEAFVLTTDMDQIVGGDGDDIVYGIVANTVADSTLQPFDNIDLGDGVNTLDVTLSGDDYLGDSTLSNIDIVQAKATGAAREFETDGLNLMTVVNNRSSQNLTFDNVESADTEVDLYRISTANTTKVTFKNPALTGTDTNIDVNLDGVAVDENLTLNSTGTDGIEDVTITSEGSEANKLGTLLVENSANTKTLQNLMVTGDQDLTIANAVEFIAGATNTAKVDATGYTGDLEISFDDADNTAKLDIQGGDGDDTFVFGANRAVAATDTIDGGLGTDRIVVADDFTTALSNVTNIDEIELEVADIGDGVTKTVSGAAVDSATNFVVNSNTATDADEATVAVTNLDDGDTVTVLSAGSDDDALADGVALTGTFATDGTNDSLTLAFNGIGAVTDDASDATGIAEVTFDSVENLNVEANYNSTKTVNTNEVEKLSADALKNLMITGDGDLTFQDMDNTSALTSIDATELTGKLSITGLDASNVNLMAGSGQTTISMAGLNASDTIVGGANTKDTLTGTAVTGLTATTGKLNITDFETVRIQATGANTVDASLLSGVNTLSFSGATPGNQTVTNVGEGLVIGIGDSDAVFDNDATLSVALADATGTNDELTFKVDNSKDANTDVALKVADVENVNLAFLDGADASANNATFNLSQVAAGTINVTGGLAGTELIANGGTDDLNASTSTFDASGFKGSVRINRADGTGAGTITLAGDTTNAHAVQGSDTVNDTVTIGSTTDYRGAIADTLVGGTGQTDSLTIYAKNGFASLANVSEFEDITVSVRPGEDVTLTNVAGFNDAELNNIMVVGGNELSTFKTTAATGAATAQLFDASSFSGNVDLLIDEDAIEGVDLEIKGGALTTDSVSVELDDEADYKFKTSGIETIGLKEDGASTVDFTNVTGAQLLAVDSSANLKFDNLAAGVAIQAGLTAGTAAQLTPAGGVNGATLDINYASTTGSTDAMTLNLADTNDAGATATFDIDGIETINIEHVKRNDGADPNVTTWESHTVSLAGSANATNKIALNITGGDSGETITFANSGLVADVNSVDASELASALDISAAARLNTGAMTIEGGSAADTIAMENASDSLDAGAGADSLEISFNAILGGIEVDLSQTGDQVTTFNGSANAAVQTDFQHVDVSGYTGNFGAQITANSAGSTIVGTGNADQINGGKGDDVITGGDGGDVLTGGAGDDIFNYTATTDSDAGGDLDAIQDFDGTSASDQIAFDADAASASGLFGAAVATSNLRVLVNASSFASAFQSVGVAGLLASASASSHALSAFFAGTFSSATAFKTALSSVAYASQSTVSSANFVAFALNASGTQLYVAQGILDGVSTASNAQVKSAAIIMTIGLNAGSGIAAGDIILY